jgi:hypothetical protein
MTAFRDIASLWPDLLLNLSFPEARRSDRPPQRRMSMRASVVYDRRAQLRNPKPVEMGLSPSVRAFFKRAERGDPQRNTIALVPAAHHLMRVMWALLKRGTVWEEKLTLSKEPNSA